MDTEPSDKRQGLIIGYCVDDFVGADAKCRFIVDLVGKLDLSKLYARKSKRGAPPYDPAMMLALWFLAYSEGVDSSRKLEEKCRRDLYYKWTSGNKTPDHASLARFRRRNEDLMWVFFMEIVHLAQAQGRARFETIAGDGTRIQAAASVRQTRSVEDVNRELEKIREDIKSFMGSCQNNDGDRPEDEEDGEGGDSGQQEMQKETAGGRNRGVDIDDLFAQQARLEKAKEVLEERSGKLTKNQDRHQVNIVEPDACLCNMVNGRQKLPAYNAQITVDTETRLIAACDLVQDRTDANQLIPMHARTEAVLGDDQDRNYIFDAGYFDAEAFEHAEALGASVHVVDPRPSHRFQGKQWTEGEPIERHHFSYSAETDSYRCPSGKELILRAHNKKKGQVRAIYRCAGCAGCALAACCKPHPWLGKQIYRNENEARYQRNFEQMQTELGRHLTRLRRMTVETVFGILKANMGFRRFKRSGLEAARAEFTLMCIGYNLNRLFRMALSRLFRGLFDALHVLYAHLHSLRSILLPATSSRRFTFYFAA